MKTTITESWFMKQHFNETELLTLKSWEDKSGMIAEAFLVDGRYQLHHVEDVNKSIILCVMDEEYMVRRWAERLGFAMKDGLSCKEFEAANGIVETVYEQGVEIYRNEEEGLFITKYKDHVSVVSHKPLVGIRTASNSYNLQLMTSEGYAEYLKNKENDKGN